MYTEKLLQVVAKDKNGRKIDGLFEVREANINRDESGEAVVIIIGAERVNKSLLQFNKNEFYIEQIFARYFEDGSIAKVSEEFRVKLDRILECRTIDEIANNTIYCSVIA